MRNQDIEILSLLMNIQEKIDQYLQGSLSTMEKEHLEQELVSLGPEVAAELKDMKLIKEVIRQNVVHEKLAFLKSLEHKEQPKSEAKKSNKIYIYFLLIFALAAAVFYYVTNQNSSKYNYEDYYQNYAYTGSFRSIDEEITNEDNQGFQAYASGNYPLSVSLLEGIETNEALFYKGLAFMEMKDFTNAIKSFETVQNSKYPVLYFLSLSYLENDNLIKAKQSLQKIPQHQTLYYTKAQDLLQKL